MGGRLPLTMRGASIGSSRSPETPKTRELERPAQRCRALPPTPCREPAPGLAAALKPRPARRRNPFSAKMLAAADVLLAALCTNRSAADEPNRGLTRLMRTGIVGSNLCGVIRDI